MGSRKSTRNRYRHTHKLIHTCRKQNKHEISFCSIYAKALHGLKLKEKLILKYREEQDRRKGREELQNIQIGETIIRIHCINYV